MLVSGTLVYSKGDAKQAEAEAGELHTAAAGFEGAPVPEVAPLIGGAHPQAFSPACEECRKAEDLKCAGLHNLQAKVHRCSMSYHSAKATSILLVLQGTVCCLESCQGPSMCCSTHARCFEG